MLHGCVMAKCEGAIFYIREVPLFQLPLTYSGHCAELKATGSKWKEQCEMGGALDLILSICSATLQGTAQDADVEGHSKQFQNVSD